jgi:DNA-binding transcriptional LysR family regulator
MQNSPPRSLLRTRLKTRQLLLMIALDEQRNIHRAAEELHMTQPAASKQLKDLEDLLEVKLFERLSHGMEPTLYGQTMIRHARMAVTSLSLAHEDIAVLKSGLSGQVAIGAILSSGMSLLPRAISRVKQEAPTMRIGVEVENSNVLLDRLRRGTLDFLVARMLDNDARSELHYEELASETICVVARVDHPFLAAASLRLDDIARAPWVLPPHGSVLRLRCDTMFHRAGLVPPDNVVETTALLLIISLLRHSDSLHLMSLDVARYYAQHAVLAILPIDVAVKMDGFGLITRRNYMLSPSAAVLLDAIRVASQEIY